MSDQTNHGRLLVAGKPGVEFQVINASGEGINQGAEKAELTVPAGLYAIRWHSAGRSSESLVRVNSNGESVATYDGPGSPVARSLLPEEPPVSSEIMPTQTLPASESLNTAITVVVGSTDQQTSGEVIAQVKVLDQSFKGLEGVGSTAVLNLLDSEVLQHFEVKPGRYILQYRSTTGETFQQSLVALQGRQTIVFLQAIMSDVLWPEGGSFKVVKNTGVDPCRTVLLSVNGTEDEVRIRERARLTDVLLHDLAKSGQSLSTDFISILDDNRTDPFLKLLGSLVVIQWVGQHVDAQSSAAAHSVSELLYWLGLVRTWLNAIPQNTAPSDRCAANWEITRLLEILGDTVEESAPSRNFKIHYPPMYANAWRWAVAFSLKSPGAIRKTPLTLAAGRSSSDFEPWLCWKASAAKASRLRTSSRATESATSLIKQFRENVSSLSIDQNSAIQPFDELNLNLSPETLAMAMRVVAGREEIEVRSDQIDFHIATTLAKNFGLPDEGLRRRLARANTEIESLITGYDSTPNALSDEQSRAPALARAIINPDDPQKGRFGGNSIRRGFKLEAAFEETRSKDLIRLTLSVSGPAKNGEKAQFYLHDSFTPLTRQEPFKGGRLQGLLVAEHSVVAWGGFTVGVWLPERGVELELDLTRVPGAPLIIRTR